MIQESNFSYINYIINILINKNRIQFTSLSWINESNELIDFNNGILTENNFTITKPTNIYKFFNQILIENEDNPLREKPSENLIKLGEIIIKNSKYYFKPNIVQSNNIYYTTEITKLSWLVYKNKKPPFDKTRYSLKEGDVIKLGRETLLVRDIHVKKNKIKAIKLNYNETMNKNNKGIFSFHTVTSQSPNLDDDFNDSKNQEKEKYDSNVKEKIGEDKVEFASVNQENEKKSKTENEILVLNNNKKKKICRICYLEEENRRLNPLIKPCKCSGSMKYIHYECLLHWLRTKLIINKRSVIDNGFFDIYRLDLIECELCKNHLLNYIKHNNKIYSLIDYQRLDKQMEKLLSKKEKAKLTKENNYITFDDVLPGKNGFLCRYLVKFNDDNTLKIGRGLDNQLILNDISVSRNHCLIRIDQGYNLILEDCNSKFGSLVLIQAEEIEILKGKILTVQSGTNYFNFKLELPKKNIFSCCSAEEIDEKNDYEKINSSWVKFDKKGEIYNESISGMESNDEKAENKSNNNIDININKDNANNNQSKNDKDNNEEIVEIEKEKNEGDDINIIKIDGNKIEVNNTNNTNNFNNMDSAVNISTLKVNNAVNFSQIENLMNSIEEEKKSEIEQYSDKRSKNNHKENKSDVNINDNKDNESEIIIKENSNDGGD